MVSSLKVFMYIAHCSFLLQVPKLVVYIQAILRPGCKLPEKEAAVCNIHKPFKLPTLFIY